MLEKLGITPGPWELRNIFYGTPHDVVTDKDGWSGHIICSGWGYESKEPEFRLIAAAPEMLEALIDGLKMIESMTGFIEVDSNEYSFYMDSVEVIEKATGRTWAEVKELIC